MNLRESTVYVRRQTARRLWWIARSQGKVADALADELLTEALETKWPALMDAEKDIAVVRKKFQAAIGGEETDLD